MSTATGDRGDTTRRRYVKHGGVLVGSALTGCTGRDGDGGPHGGPHPEIHESERLFDRERVAAVVRGDA